MSNAKNQLVMTGLYKVLKQLAEELDRDATLLQAMMFVRVAMAGEAGFNPSQLESELKASSPAITRTSQKLSALGAPGATGKPRSAGYDVARIDFDPDNRSLRVLSLTPKGERAVVKLAATLSKI